MRWFLWPRGKATACKAGDTGSSPVRNSMMLFSVERSRTSNYTWDCASAYRRLRNAAASASLENVKWFAR